MFTQGVQRPGKPGEPGNVWHFKNGPQKSGIFEETVKVKEKSRNFLGDIELQTKYFKFLVAV